MNKSYAEFDFSRLITDFVKPVQTAVRSDQTVAQALDALRQQKISNNIIYFYVVDEQQKLVGVVPTRTLLLSGPDDLVGKIMQHPVICLPSSATFGDAAAFFNSHHLLALPVVDEQEKLLGTVDVRLFAEDALDFSRSARQFDLFQLIGLSLQQMQKGSVFSSFRFRMPWLVCNLVSGLACAVVGHYYREVLREVVLLAMFFPLVLTLSESISMQSMTLTIQYLHGSMVRWGAVIRRAQLEWGTAALLGLSGGVVVGMVAMLWRQGIAPPTVIAVTIACSMIISATLGITIPVLLHATRMDPKVAAGPVTLMLVDLVTTVTYLSLATWWLL